MNGEKFKVNNIVLCGFMGCGKSTVGKNIARKSGRKFLDMDSYIEEKAGMTVSEIFEKYGEEKFRDMEHDACVELAGLEGLVIASGGKILSVIVGVRLHSREMLRPSRARTKLFFLMFRWESSKAVLKMTQQDPCFSVRTGTGL